MTEPDGSIPAGGPARTPWRARWTRWCGGWGSRRRWWSSRGTTRATSWRASTGRAPRGSSGKGGETIDALQYLLSQIASRAEGGSRRRVSLDADGYRARRAAALEDLADRAAREAVEFGEEIELDPMTPHDRRIVHMALKDRTEVVTRSEGDEPRRRIIVEPAE